MKYCMEISSKLVAERGSLEGMVVQLFYTEYTLEFAIVTG